MNPSYEISLSSSSPQGSQHSHHHHHHHTSHKSPNTASHPEDSHSSSRQRVRTEPSPRHEHTSTGWLGPYNEQSSPIPSIKSPRGPRLPSIHLSPAAAERGPGDSSMLSVGDAHRALGRRHVDDNNTTDIGDYGNGRGTFRKREFDPKQSEVGYSGSSIEQSSSLQSLVESIDENHVFKLTEMTKKRVEHNNPGQKRQRVVSLPTTEASQAAKFQPSENTLQFSNSCKASLESKYTLLYQSINAGHPINRLRRLHEIQPQIESISIPKRSRDGKHSMDLMISRSRWPKSDKYHFVDKVEESSCIWDVDHMEKAIAAEAARLAAESTSRHGSQQNLEQSGGASSKSSSHYHLPSTSTESFTVEDPASKDSHITPTIITNQLLHDSPLATVDTQNMPMGMSPSSTFSSIASPAHSPSSDPNALKHLPKENSGESKLRFVEPSPIATKNISPPTIKLTDGSKGSNNNMESPNPDSLQSKRNSFLGIFGVRGKKVGQDSDHSNHYESPQSSGYGSPRLTATQERRSFDSQHIPYSSSSTIQPQTQQNQLTLDVGLPPFLSSPSTHSAGSYEAQARRSTSHDEAGGTTSVDDDNGGHWATASQWPQGERMEESQDESDSQATAADKRSSLRRLKDKMTWKRGPKTLSVIQQNETYQNPNLNPSQGKSTILDGTKSLGKKGDPSLAHLHEQYSARPSTSEPSSGRNSIDNPSRPKTNIRALSGTSSPILEAVRSTDGIIGMSSPRFGPISDTTNRMDKSPTVYPTKGDRSPMVIPVTRTEKSPMLNPSRTDKPVLSVAEEQATPAASQMLVDVDRIPKRLLERLKSRPELASIDWSEDTVDLSPMWSSSEPIPTYAEYFGISSDMKSFKLYPSHLNDIDVMEIHLTLGMDDLKDNSAKSRVRKWDLLELRLDQEVDKCEKWIQDTMEWSASKIDSIQKHTQQETSNKDGVRFFDASIPLVEEPEEEEDLEEGKDDSMDGVSSDPPASTSTLAAGNEMKHFLRPSPEILRSRRQQRELSLLSVRDIGPGGSSMSLHHHSSTSVTYTFRASLDSTRVAVEEMRKYMDECRKRLQQLDGATQLLKKEPIFKEVVDKFTREWNDSYFVKLKEVEDQIQTMNLKRIENPWMDMLLIMLSWLIRGLFYIVEGVTIMIIIARHSWGKARRGYEVLRNSKREQQRVSRGGVEPNISKPGTQEPQGNTTKEALVQA
ncbi:hypothetical protein BGZ46_007249 [Entomortierella lignicola]|nr:hypothetical protein BGZ46_007249 [Entomortierella lignicola]